MNELAIPTDGSAMDAMPANSMGYPVGKSTIEVATTVKRPVGITQSDWQTAISGAAELFRKSSGLDAPTRENLEPYCDVSSRAMDILFGRGHDQFVQALILRGIVRMGRNLDERQVMALAVLGDYTSPLNIRQKLNRIGVKWYEYQNWMQDPKFSGQMRAIAENALEQATAPAMIGLAERAQVNDNSLKYMLQLTGRYDPNNSATQDVRAFLNGVIEIIQRNVTDRETLTHIGDELAFLLKAHGGT